MSEDFLQSNTANVEKVHRFLLGRASLWMAVIDWSQFRGELYACLAFLDFLHFQFFILI